MPVRTTLKFNATTWICLVGDFLTDSTAVNRRETTISENMFGSFSKHLVQIQDNVFSILKFRDPPPKKNAWAMGMHGLLALSQLRQWYFPATEKKCWTCCYQVSKKQLQGEYVKWQEKMVQLWGYTNIRVFCWFGSKNAAACKQNRKQNGNYSPDTNMTMEYHQF